MPSRNAPSATSICSASSASSTSAKIAIPPGKTGRRCSESPGNCNRSAWPAACMVSISSSTPARSSLACSPRSPRITRAAARIVPEVPIKRAIGRVRKRRRRGSSSMRAASRASANRCLSSLPSAKNRWLRLTQPSSPAARVPARARARARYCHRRCRHKAAPHRPPAGRARHRGKSAAPPRSRR